MTDDKFLEIAAQCWCDPRVSDRVMDAEMAQVFADALRQAYDQGLEDAANHVGRLWALGQNREQIERQILSLKTSKEKNWRNDLKK